MFSPMGNAKRYLVIVAQGGDVPDLDTLGCFVASGVQAINYNPGVSVFNATVYKSSHFVNLVLASSNDCS